ncbi:MAG: diguanylate cyclase DgcA [Spirochaetia bacterium]
MNQQNDNLSEQELLLVEYEKQIFDLKQLIEISKSFSSTLDYNIVIDSILYACIGQMKVLQAGLFTRKGLDGAEFALHRNYKGFDVSHDSEYIIAETHPIIPLFTEKFRCYTLEAIEKELGSLEGLEALVALKPNLAIPLRAKGQVNGIIVLGERIADEVFSDYEQEYLLNIALLSGIAIHNAYLFEMTTTDMMTKLRMKHYFLSVLMEKQEEAVELDVPLSLIMIDIDHFKVLNDTYGHTCGDYVLKEVANAIQENVRQNDIAARYGGEEFSILLPESDLDTAYTVAERIRSAIESLELYYDDIEINTSISLGVAEYNPLIDTTSRLFIDRADKALYLSKQNGRNKVSTAKHRET